MLYTYYLRKDTIRDECGMTHTVYGIEAISPSGCFLQSFPDIFFDRQKAEHFVHLCNEKSLSPIHLADIVDDLLAVYDAG